MAGTSHAYSIKIPSKKIVEKGSIGHWIWPTHHLNGLNALQRALICKRIKKKKKPEILMVEVASRNSPAFSCVNRWDAILAIRVPDRLS